jgi:dTDP-4-amino-4,6-dideoxygalactose transaminase
MVEDICDRRWLTNDGPYVKEFERLVAHTIGVRNCVAMCNATVALEIAIRALGLTGEVIIPSFTFVATAHALQWQEITPVFCDIDPVTHTLDLSSAARVITPRTTGIIAVNLWGQVCNVPALEAFAAHHGIRLLFDSAHAFGCSHEGIYAGSFGAAEVFSFHATKFLNAGEGGAFVTNNDDLAERARNMRNFGFTGIDEVRHIGTNGKMSELSAALGISNLLHLPEIQEANRTSYEAYTHELGDIAGLSSMRIDRDEHRNFQYVVAEVDPSEANLERDELLDVLWAENVRARRYFSPGCHRMEPYASFFPNAGLLLPHTEAVCDRVLVLPTGVQLGRGDVRTVSSIIRRALEQSEQVRVALRQRSRLARVTSEAIVQTSQAAR